MQDIEDTLLTAARGCGWSIAELARRAGLPYSAVHGFVRSDRLITLRSAARLAEALGLELRPVRRARRKRGE